MKGGVGKTTMVYHRAWMFADRGEGRGAAVTMKEELYWLCNACGAYKLVEKDSGYQYADWEQCANCGKGVSIVVLQSELWQRFVKGGV